MRRIVWASCVLLCLAVPVVVLSALAQEIQVGVVQPPVNFSVAGSTQVDMKIEPSAVEPVGDGSLLLIADDNTDTLVLVEAATGKIKQRLQLGTFDRKPKWEAMARDDEGAYYVIGSHSVKPDEDNASEKLKARSRLFRFRLTSGASDTLPTIDASSVIEWDLTEALAVEGYSSDPLKNKVKIEGLTVRISQEAKTNKTVRELVVGLRELSVPVRVYAADITQLPATKAKLALSPLFKFDAGSRQEVLSQLSSLEYVPAWHGFLLLTSTEDPANAFHGSTLWFVSDAQIAAAVPENRPVAERRRIELSPVEPQKVWVFGIDSKAEGLCVLSEAASAGQSQTRQARIALVYDNDTPKTNMAGALQLLTLVRWPK